MGPSFPEMSCRGVTGEGKTASPAHHLSYKRTNGLSQFILPGELFF